MRKLRKGRKLSRKRDQRKALLKSLARSLFIYGKIKATEVKIKEVRPLIEKIITKAKKDDFVSRRYLSQYFEKRLVKKIVDEIGPRYKKRQGGYTRIIKLEPRKTDGARMAMIELI